MSYAYSLDRDRFIGEFDTREVAAKAAFDNDPSEEVALVGEVVKTKAADHVTLRRIENLLEDLNQSLENVEADWPDLGEEPKKELAKLIADFLDKHRPVDFFTVRDVTFVRRESVCG